MKKIIILIALFTLVIAGTASALITGSKHDLSSTGTSLSYSGAAPADQLCIYCHTPHNAQVASGAPLWNRTLGITTKSGSVYGSPTFDGSGLVAAVPRAGTVTPLCMSCHDGTKAVASYYRGGVEQDTIKPKMDNRLFTDPVLSELDLAINHPVDFQYVAVTQEIAGSIKVGVIGGAVPQTYPLSGSDQNFTCTTCHDVHNTSANGMLRGAETLSGSAFCLACHDK